MWVGDCEESSWPDLVFIGLVLVDVFEESEVVECVDGGAAECGLVDPFGFGPFLAEVSVDDPFTQIVFEVVAGWDEMAESVFRPFGHQLAGGVKLACEAGVPSGCRMVMV